MRLAWIPILLQILLAPKLQAEVQYEYPELLVTPSAHETLAAQAKSEKKSKWMVHIWSQIPATINLFTGLRMMGEGEANPEPPSSPFEEDNSDDLRKKFNTGAISTLVAGAWLGTTVAMSSMYSPYVSDYLSVRKMPSKTKRQKLAKERRSEEVLRDAASTGTKLKYIGAALNLGTASLMMSATDDEQTNVQASLAAAASLLPLLFDYTWNAVYDQHLEYKKKIYAPVVELQYQPSRSGELDPVLAFRWNW